MTCRNLCERLYSKIIVGKSKYQEGRNIVDDVRFISCMILYDGLFCPCCGMRLRLSPVNKRDRNRLREIHGLEQL